VWCEPCNAPRRWASDDKRFAPPPVVGVAPLDQPLNGALLGGT